MVFDKKTGYAEVDVVEQAQRLADAVSGLFGKVVGQMEEQGRAAGAAFV